MSHQEEVYSEGNDVVMQEEEEYQIEEQEEAHEADQRDGSDDECESTWAIGIYLQAFWRMIQLAFATILHQVLITFDRAVHLDAAIVVVYSFIQLYRAWQAPQETYDYYVGMSPFGEDMVTARYFSYIMKILINKQSHHENRSTLRNIVFDAFRCQFGDIIYPFLHAEKGGLDYFTSEHCNRMLVDFAWIAVMSAFVTNVVKRDTWFRRQRLVWALLNVEYNSTYACGWLHMLEHLETDYNGNYFAIALLAFIENHFHIGGDWIEELWYGDMSKSTRFGIGGETFFFNMPTYLGQLVALPISLVLQIAYTYANYGGSTTVVEQVSQDGSTTVTETTTYLLRYNPFDEANGWPDFWFLKIPIRWTVFDYSNQSANPWASTFFVGTVLAFTLSAIFWQLDFLEKCRLQDEKESGEVERASQEFKSVASEEEAD